MVRTFTDDDLPGIWDLYTLVFGESALRGIQMRWEWQFINNPFNTSQSPNILVFELHGEIVGFIASFPLPFRINMKSEVAYFLTDFVTHPKHRMCGISLAKKITSLPIITMGAPNQTSVNLWLALGTNVLYHAETRVAVIQRKGMSRSRPKFIYTLMGLLSEKIFTGNVRTHGYLIETIDEFTLPEVKDCIAAHLATIRSGVQKTDEYLHWRYVEHPVREYRIYIAKKNGSVDAIAIVSLNYTRRQFKTAVLLELLTRKPGSRAAGVLMKTLFTHLKERGVERVYAIANKHHPKTKKNLMRYGFCFSGGSQKVIGYSKVETVSQEDLAMDHLWNVSYGDGELELIL